MATTELQAESATVTPSFNRAYADYRHTKAALDLMIFDPTRDGKDIPKELSSPFTDQHLAALDRLLVFPVTKASELVLKLEAFHDEEVYLGWHNAEEITLALLADARRIAFGD